MIRSRLTILRLCLAAATAAILCQAGAHAAAEPRSLVLVNRPEVMLRDLFTDAGPAADTVLGAAPAPGARILVGTRQLAAIAQQYGVDWVANGTDPSVIIERPGTPIQRMLIVDALKSAVRQAGAPDHIVVEIADRDLPMIPPHIRPQILVNRVTYDRLNGNFRADILITAHYMNAINLPVTGLVVKAVQTLVATHDLQPGEILEPADIAHSWIARGALPQGAVRDMASALGMQVQRVTKAGSPLAMRALMRPMLIKRGATVSLDVAMPGLDVTARGVAMAAGGKGAVIPVLNPSSREIVQAVVDGPNRAHVVPGSMPAQSHGPMSFYDPYGKRR